MNKTFDVLITGYYGFGNLGDELLLEACIGNLQKNGVPKERIAVLSNAPEETARRYGVRAFDRWKLPLLAAVMRQSRSLLLGGGGLFQDATSVKSCLYYWWLVRLARIEKAKVWTIGQSVGPLRTLRGKFFAKSAFSKCVWRGVRDDRSLQQLKAWGLDAVQTPDLVMGLDVRQVPPQNTQTLLLNLRPWPGALARETASLVHETAQRRGLQVRGVALSPADAALLDDLRAKRIVKLQEITLVKTREDFENCCKDAAGAVGMRLHFLILSLLAGIPLCAAPYDPKVEALQKEYNIPVAEESGDGLAFSRPMQENLARTCGAEIDEAFRAAFCAVFGEEK